jgi:hypothetical protein
VIQPIVRALAVLVTAVLATGPTLGLVCESLCPAHAREGAAHQTATATTTHVHEAAPVHHHPPSTLHTAATTARLDVTQAACCGTPASADATLTSGRTGSTRHAMASAAAYRVLAMAAHAIPGPARYRAGPLLNLSSHSPISPTLRI